MNAWRWNNLSLRKVYSTTFPREAIGLLGWARMRVPRRLHLLQVPNRAYSGVRFIPRDALHHFASGNYSGDYKSLLFQENAEDQHGDQTHFRLVELCRFADSCGIIFRGSFCGDLLPPFFCYG